MSDAKRAREFRVDHVDPFNINVDGANERTENLHLRELEESIAKQGIIHPPLVRPGDAKEMQYEVFAGQRRVLAAQALEDVEEVPVLVFENYSDADAIAASITENADVFQEDVAPSDRARALLQLWEAMGNDPDTMPSPTELAEELGVPKATVSTWLEPLRTPWGERLGGGSQPVEKDDSDATLTPTGPAPNDDVGRTGAYDSHTTQEDVDQLGERTLQALRTAVDDDEAAATAAGIAADADLSRREAEELAKRIDAGAPPERAAHAVGVDAAALDPAAEYDLSTESDTDEGTADERNGSDSPSRVTVDVTLSGEAADALSARAKERGAAEDEVARFLLERVLVGE